MYDSYLPSPYMGNTTLKIENEINSSALIQISKIPGGHDTGALVP